MASLTDFGCRACLARDHRRAYTRPVGGFRFVERRARERGLPDQMTRG
jgi:hypothetical protein